MILSQLGFQQSRWGPDGSSSHGCHILFVYSCLPQSYQHRAAEDEEEG